MEADLTSQPDFLMTELRYTLGQLHVQLGDIGSSVQADAEQLEARVRKIVDTMIEDEGRYQSQYARFLNLPPAPPPDAGPPQGQEEAFAQKREQTLSMLQQAGGNWPQELIDCVQQQVANDRKHTTEIAEQRKVQFEHDQRPDLDQPLTTPG